MKYLFAIAFLIGTLSCSGQFNRGTALITAGNISIPVKGLGIVETGIGISFDAHFFSTHRLHALIESSADCFIGDKRGSLFNAFSSVGPQFFVTKNLALALTYGTSWNAIQADGFKYSISWFKKRFAAKAFLISIPGEWEQNLQYAGVQYTGIAIGIRIL